MKNMLSGKTVIWGIALVLILTLTACNHKSNTSSSTFPDYDNADIPDILELTVGTRGDTFFSTGITDADYNSVLNITFLDTTEADYTTLMEHYQTSSTGTDEDGFLLFDWGRLQVTTEDDSILITALIK